MKKCRLKILGWIGGSIALFLAPGLIKIYLHEEEQSQILNTLQTLEDAAWGMLLISPLIPFLGFCILVAWGFGKVEQADGESIPFVNPQSEFWFFRWVGRLTIPVPWVLNGIALGAVTFWIDSLPEMRSEFAGELPWLYLADTIFWVAGTVILSSIRVARYAFWGLLFSPILVPLVIMVKGVDAFSLVCRGLNSLWQIFLHIRLPSLPRWRWQRQPVRVPSEVTA